MTCSTCPGTACHCHDNPLTWTEITTWNQMIQWLVARMADLEDVMRDVEESLRDDTYDATSRTRRVGWSRSGCIGRRKLARLKRRGAP